MSARKAARYSGVPRTRRGCRRQTTQKLLEEDVKERPAATMVERRRFLEGVTGKALSDSTIGRLLRRMGFSPKNGVWGRWSETSG